MLPISIELESKHVRDPMEGPFTFNHEVRHILGSIQSLTLLPQFRVHIKALTLIPKQKTKVSGRRRKSVKENILPASLQTPRPSTSAVPCSPGPPVKLRVRRPRPSPVPKPSQSTSISKKGSSSMDLFVPLAEDPFSLRERTLRRLDSATASSSPESEPHSSASDLSNAQPSFQVDNG